MGSGGYGGQGGCISAGGLLSVGRDEVVNVKVKAIYTVNITVCATRCNK